RVELRMDLDVAAHQRPVVVEVGRRGPGRGGSTARRGGEGAERPRAGRNPHAHPVVVGAAGLAVVLDLAAVDHLDGLCAVRRRPVPDTREARLVGGRGRRRGPAARDDAASEAVERRRLEAALVVLPVVGPVALDVSGLVEAADAAARRPDLAAEARPHDLGHGERVGDAVDEAAAGDPAPHVDVARGAAVAGDGVAVVALLAGLGLHDAVAAAGAVVPAAVAVDGVSVVASLAGLFDAVAAEGALCGRARRTTRPAGRPRRTVARLAV